MKQILGMESFGENPDENEDPLFARELNFYLRSLIFTQSYTILHNTEVFQSSHFFTFSFGKLPKFYLKLKLQLSPVHDQEIETPVHDLSSRQTSKPSSGIANLPSYLLKS